MPDIPKTTMQEIMTRQIVTVSMDESLKHVQELFEQNRFHHLLVVEGRKLVGIISDRDLLHNVSPFVGHQFTERPQDVATLNRRAHQIMSRKLITATAVTTLPEATALILEHHISCLPIVDDQSHPLGIVSWRDLLKILTSPVER